MPLKLLNKYGLLFHKDRTDSSFTIFYKHSYSIYEAFLRKKFRVFDNERLNLALGYGFEYIWSKINAYDPKKGSFSTWSHYAILNGFYRVFANKKTQLKIVYVEQIFDKVKFNAIENQDREKYNYKDLFKMLDTVNNMNIYKIDKQVFYDKYFLKMTYEDLNKKYRYNINTLKSKIYRITFYLRRGHGPPHKVYFLKKIMKAYNFNLKDDKIRFYHSKEWQNLRDIKLAENPFCEKCDGSILANEIHHIKDIETYPECALEFENLEALCKPCHSRETIKILNKSRDKTLLNQSFNFNKNKYKKWK